MYAVRQWSVRHARGLNAFYRAFESVLVALHPLFKRLGYERLERPVATVERTVKGLLFDCLMCGQCILSSTGMSCPMNCPKNLRNGPCGGVRADGACEVFPDRPCVWVEAWEGSKRLPLWRDHMHHLNPPVDWRLNGTSSWINLVTGRDRRAPAGWAARAADADPA